MNTDQHAAQITGSLVLQLAVALAKIDELTAENQVLKKQIEKETS